MSFLILKDDSYGERSWYLETWSNGVLVESYEVETCETENYKNETP